MSWTLLDLKTSFTHAMIFKNWGRSWLEFQRERKKKNIRKQNYEKITIKYFPFLTLFFVLQSKDFVLFNVLKKNLIFLITSFRPGCDRINNRELFSWVLTIWLSLLNVASGLDFSKTSPGADWGSSSRVFWKWAWQSLERKAYSCSRFPN